jgi:hypothetical protein
MSGLRGSYYIPIPIGLRPVYDAYEPIPYTAALGQAFSFGWRKEFGKKRGHAEVAWHDPRRALPKKAPSRVKSAL